MPVNLLRNKSRGVYFDLAVGVCCLLACCRFVHAAQAQYVIDSWTTDNGLPQNSVLSIAQTPDGYLWFATFDGLVRFDGVRFTVFNKGNSPGLTSNRFVRLLCDRDGVLWAGTEDGGLLRHRDGRFRAWTMADGLISPHILDIHRDIDGSLWIQTHAAIGHLSADNRIAMDPRDWTSYKIYVSPGGSRWEADRTGLLLTRNGRVTRFPFPFDPLHPAPKRGSLPISDLQMDEAQDGVLWLAAAGRLYRMEGSAVTRYTAEGA
jgi:ligand-binding sensor domain-containing protein